MRGWWDGVGLRLGLVPRTVWPWLGWAAVGGLYELVTWATGHSGLTLSAQVWWFAGVTPTWVSWLLAAAFGGSVAVLTLHFWGDRARD